MAGEDALTQAIRLAREVIETQRHIRIPRMPIELPPFAGSPLDWLIFNAAYNASAADYTDFENLTRLRKALRGPAREIVSNQLIFNTTSPGQIIEALAFQYGRPDAIIEAEVERFKSAPRVRDTPQDICTFVTKVMNLVAVLRSMDNSEQLNNKELVKVTVEKLPPTIQNGWFHYAFEDSSNKPILEKFAAFIKQEALLRGPYMRPEKHEDTTYHAPPQKTAPMRRAPTGAAPARRASHRTFAANATPTEPECTVCGKGNHSAGKCEKFAQLTVDDRWATAKAKDLCYRCLRPRDKKHTCKLRRCDTDRCPRSHHPLLHFIRRNPVVGEEPRQEVVHHARATQSSTGFVKILPVTAVGPQGSADVYALLDDGSTVTLIDADVAKKIGADGPVQPLHIEGLSTEMDVSDSQFIEVQLRTDVGSATIEAHTCGNMKLSAPRLTPADMEGCDHLTDLLPHFKYGQGLSLVWTVTTAPPTRSLLAGTASHTPERGVYHIVIVARHRRVPFT
ncbi:hypothetical protein NE865_08084 [Phthorimaea operculella]|nr:hypothetical protein NE865_08084 [Phthorimaea operculella]